MQLLFCKNGTISTKGSSKAVAEQSADVCRKLSDLVVRILQHPHSAVHHPDVQDCHIRVQQLLHPPQSPQHHESRDSMARSC